MSQAAVVRDAEKKSPLRALATHLNAQRLGIADRTGALRPGPEADIVFLTSNPATDIRDIEAVELIVSDGRAWTLPDLLTRKAELLR